jgi:hypothetical protein
MRFFHEDTAQSNVSPSYKTPVRYHWANQLWPLAAFLWALLFMDIALQCPCEGKRQT